MRYTARMTSVPSAHPVSFSALREQAYLVFPNDLNARDTVFGGLIMAHMDRYAVVVADRHAGGRLVSLLEGGYDLLGLERSAAAHVARLMAG